MLLALSGCAQSQLEHQTDSFNRATANAINEQTLLNAVRSSLDMPLSFTKLLKFTASSMASGSLAPKLPFGADASRIFDFGPTLSLSGGVGQIEYADANNSGALAKLNENLKYDTFDRYVQRGLHPFLLQTVLVEYVEIHADLYDSVLAERRKACDAKPSLIGCVELKESSKRCGWGDDILDPVIKINKVYKIRVAHNRAAKRCDFERFQAFLYHLFKSGYASDLTVETIPVKQKTPEGTLLDVPKTSTGQGVVFQNADVQRKFAKIEKDLEKYYKKEKKAGKRTGERRALKFGFRSPASLLSYLGELIALQNFANEKLVPEVRVGPDDKLTVFRVLRGTPPPEGVALSVRGPDGKTYYVPWPDYGKADKRDQTLRVLAIASELVNGALSDKDFPAPSSVVVRSF